MKKCTVFFSGILLVLLILFGMNHFLQAKERKGVSGNGSQNSTVTIFNWGEYIDPDLLKKFEKETGYQVVYETFESNEGMETKVKQGGTSYDIIFPSESIIPRLLQNKLLKPLDQTKIKGLENISPYLLDQAFDQGNQYTVPYFWGTIGIMVNTEMIHADEITKWSDLWKEQYQNDILLIDGARESLGMALQTMGYSLNNKSDKKLEEAALKLAKLTPNVKAVLTDEIKTLMKQGDAPIGIGYSGDAASVMYENEAVTYVIPEDGTAIWTDNFAIPKTVKNEKGAYAFINFMLRPENAAQNASYVGYATPNEKAKTLLPKEITSDERFYPPVEIANSMEHYQYLGREWVEKYNDLFLEFKMGL